MGEGRTHTCSPDTVLAGLDEAQREAASTVERFVLVAAPPGSGKTSVLAHRYACLLERGIDPSRILAVTFTNRAAEEMAERISTLTGLETSSLNIGTFHSLCLRFLKTFLPPFRLYGRDETVAVLRGLGVKNPQAAAEAISRHKNLCPIGGRSDKREEEIEEVIRLYSEQMRSEGALDLDDLVKEAVAELKRETTASASFLSSFDHILVDEFQDINPIQSELLRLLARVGGAEVVEGVEWGKRVGGKSVFAIGDADQSIYSFRGGNPLAFLEFKDIYPGARLFYLKTNYRSRGRIVKASQALISNNTGRLDMQASSIREGGEIISVDCPDEWAEAGFIVKEIEALMGGLNSLSVGRGSKKEWAQSRFSDFAVLFRTNRQSDPIAGAFARSSIPYYAVSAAYTGLGEILKRLKAAPTRPGMTLYDLVKEEVEKTEAEGKEALLPLVRAASGYSGDATPEAINRFIEETLLKEPTDGIDIKADRVTLMTIHSAKGLEFKYVFLAGCEEGLLPLSFAGSTDIEEERRLFYVAMTRAKERLYLLNSGVRTELGSAAKKAATRFLKEIPEDMLKRILTGERKKGKPFQRPLFE